jgi:hypothetical protein
LEKSVSDSRNGVSFNIGNIHLFFFLEYRYPASNRLEDFNPYLDLLGALYLRSKASKTTANLVCSYPRCLVHFAAQSLGRLVEGPKNKGNNPQERSLSTGFSTHFVGKPPLFISHGETSFSGKYDDVWFGPDF